MQLTTDDQPKCKKPKVNKSLRIRIILYLKTKDILHLEVRGMLRQEAVGVEVMGMLTLCQKIRDSLGTKGPLELKSKKRIQVL